MSGTVERSRTGAACSAVAGVLIASESVVSSAARFFAPHPKRQPSAQTTKNLSISLFIDGDHIELIGAWRAHLRYEREHENNLGSARALASRELLFARIANLFRFR